ncbi:hypothetical protein DB346_19170 [Verrucomicrobia bacterium LW23]|nr:hypothetical protein DB346_19170 [Verrucomicrobia bacterium LW23]
MIHRSRCFHLAKLFAVLWCMCWVALPVQLLPLMANPSGGTVTGGSANIGGSPGNVTVNQSSQRAVINWKDFSIKHGDTTTFVQPGSSSATLNRVTGGQTSQINGTLNANGKVYLINPQGVVVGKTGRVNTGGGFTASALDVSDQEFMAGKGMTFKGSSKASVVNEGKIRAAQGDVMLIARQVENKGRITARNGEVHLVGGSEVLVQPSGTQGQRVFIKSGPGSVSNSGTIRATAAELRAAGGNEYALAVNNSGVIRATGVDRSGGRIVLKAEGGSGAAGTGRVQNSGRLIAAGKAPGKKGGSVVVTGEEVRLTSTSHIDVSSTATDGTGGTVNIGGGFQGKDPDIAHADTTILEAGSLINANGGRKGGTVVVWSDVATSFQGTITAEGAEVSPGNWTGTGGFVEVSSKGYLDFRGTVEVPGGTLLLDPATLTITTSGYGTLPGPPYANDPAQSTLNVSLISTALRFGDVILSATDAIILDAPLNTLSSATYSLTMQTTAPGGTITFNSPANLHGNLTLDTANLVLNAPITMNGSAVLSGTATTINVGAAGRIQNAVDAASTVTPATVNLAAATYYENVNISGASAKSINIMGVTGTVINGNGNRSTEGGSLDTGTGDGSVFRINAAGISVTLDTLTITNGNVGNPGGGGIYISGGATVALRNSTVRNNRSSFIASGVLLNSGTLNVTNSTIAYNSGPSDGGGLYNYAGTMTVENSTINNNNGSYGGGIFVAPTSISTTITNSTISDNAASTTGGGIRARGPVTVLNSTISDNTSSQGGGIASGASGIVTLRNTIVANSKAGTDLYTNGGSFVDGGYNIVENVGNVTGVFGLAGSNTRTATDPGLAPLGWYGGPTQTHALLAGSLALDAGGPTSVTLDQRGHNDNGARNDIGAFEARTQGSFTWTVTTRADYGPASAPIANSLRMGLDLEEKPSSIVFNIPDSEAVNGTWRITIASGATPFRVTFGVNIDGSTQPGWSTSTGPVIILSGANTTQVMTVNTLDPVVLNALGFTQGYSLSQGGAGLYVDNSFVTLSNSAVYSNRAVLSQPGGGIAIDGGTLRIIDSEIYNNFSSSSSGGGLYAYGSTVWIDNSTFYDNSSYNYGGAIEAVNLNLLAITNSTFTGNDSQYGGALDLDNSPTLIINSTIAGNWVIGDADGAGIYSYNSNVQVQNSIVANNIGDADVANNFVDLGGNLIGNRGTSVGWTTSTLVGTSASPIDALLSPLGNYGGPTKTMALLPGSLAINGGIASGAPATDQRGQTRVGNVDIGAYESRGFTYTALSGGGQSAVITNAFAAPLVVSVTALDTLLTDLTGGLVTLTVPGGGASATGTLTQTIGASNQASFSLTANDTAGSYNVVVQADPSQIFALTNSKMTLVITPTSGQSKVYGEADPGTLGTNYTITSGNLVSADSLSGLLVRDTGDNAGYYQIFLGSVGISNPGRASNYDVVLDSTPVFFEITKRPLTITPDSGQSKVYGEADPATLGTAYTITSGTLVAPGDLTGALERQAGINVGSYQILLGTLGNPNYELTLDPSAVFFSITPRALTITPDSGQAKVYGNADPTSYTYSITSGTLVSGDTFTGSLARVAGQNVGLYNILLGSLQAGPNYTVTLDPLPVSFAITPRPITITPTSGQGKAFGESDPAFTYSITTGNLVFADSLSGSLSRVPGESSGDYALLPGSLTAGGNYITTIVGGIFFTIGPVPPPLPAILDPTIIVDPALVSQLDATRGRNNEDERYYLHNSLPSYQSGIYYAPAAHPTPAGTLLHSSSYDLFSPR